VTQRKPKTPKVPGVTRAILAANMAYYIDRRFPDSPNITQKQLALARDSGIALSTLQRLMKGEVGANLETLEALASSFGAQVHDLLRARHFTAFPGQSGLRSRVQKQIDRSQEKGPNAGARRRAVTKPT
jgi:hypothetical protein